MTMNTFLGKRAVAMLLALVMLLGIVPATGTTRANAATSYKGGTEVPEPLLPSKGETRGDTSGSQRTYIDMPIEVLDFRGDGFLFESTATFGAPYSLSNSSPRQVGGVNFPGSNQNGPSGRSDDFRTVGLVEPELYNNHVVYTDATLHYVAAALSARSYIPSLGSYPRMNQHFVNKFNKGLPKGDLDSTIGKLDPPVKGEVLLWEQVETCYDLAYYMLFSLWREVPTEDVLGQETRLDGQKTDVRYNLHVPEMSRLRLYYVTNPDRNKTEYTYTSYYGTEIKDGYLYNSDTTKHGKGPSFTVMNGLGFEDPNFFGSETDINNNRTYGRNNNYGFTIHAYGGFVYSESANYYFNFSGDDDVYFYINGHLVCDLGGVHGETNKNVDVNSYAAELNLKDGQICTFDMFYAERHTTGINMQFYTNIQLMDTDVIAGKQQYESATGKQLVDGAAVNIGTETDYSFSLLNRRSFPVREVSFDDSAIGITLSKDAITLNDKTALTDIRVTYRSYDSGHSKAYEGAATEAESPTDLLTKIGAFFTEDNSNPMENCAYTYQFKAGDTLADLQALLAQGIPASCEMMIYGFHRTVNGGLFTNTMTSSCVPLVVKKDENEQPVIVTEAPIPGTASCRIYGIDMGTVSVGSPLSYVIDYGKPLSFSIADAKKALTHDSGMISEFVGLTLNGENGAIKTEEPLVFTGSAKGDWGTFTLSGDTLSYTPQSFLSGVESCYAVYRLKASSNNAVIAYVYVAVQIIPANMMYYEAEDFKGELNLIKRTTDGTTGTVTTQNTWLESENLKSEGTSGGVMQTASAVGAPTVIPDYSNRRDVLFFGFDRTDADDARYELPQYNGTNFDYSRWDFNKYYVEDAQVSDGNLTVKMQGKPTQDTTVGTMWVDCSEDGLDADKTKPALIYEPDDAEVIQIRFKMKNLTRSSTTQQPYLGLHIWGALKEGMHYPNNRPDTDAARSFSTFWLDDSVLNSDEFITWTILLGNEYSMLDVVNGIRVYFRGGVSVSETKRGTITYDYIYMGPAKDAPLQNTYGYDSSYRTDSLLSNGKSLYVEGNGVRTPNNPNPANYTEIEFSFKGTGFDLISRTDKDQTSIRVDVYTDKERTQRVPSVGGDRMLWGELKLYQIPVMSIQDLDYGTYYVTIRAADKVDSDIPFLQGLNHGNQFYLDALRIYDPIDVTAGTASATEDGRTAYAAYCADREAHPYIKEVRDILLSKSDFNAMTGNIEGALFIDYEEIPKVTVPVTGPDGEPTDATENITTPGLGADNHITTTVLTYERVGPNNEVYLDPQRLIAFKLYVYTEEIPDRFDIGCKLIDGTETVFSAVLSKGSNRGMSIYENLISSATAQYYTLPLLEEAFVPDKDQDGKDCYSAYVILQNKHAKGSNSTNHVLSITDIRVAYAKKPTPIVKNSGDGASDTDVKGIPYRNDGIELPTDSFIPVGFGVDGELKSVVDSFLEEQVGASCTEHTPGEWVTLQEALPGTDGQRARYCGRCGVLCETESFGTVGQLTFAGAAVSLQTDLAIHYKVSETFFTEQGYTDPYVVIRDNGREVILREYEIVDGKYAFVYRNIAPHRMADVITATLYATYNGELYCSESRDYSIADYCYNMLGKTEGIPAYDKLRTLLADILLYGAESQRYMSYHLDSLCTDRMTPEQLALGTAVCRELVNHRVGAYETIDNPTVTWLGAGLNLQESVAIRFKFKADSYEGLEVRVTLDGRTYKIYAKDFEYREDGVYAIFNRLNAAQMSEPVYVAVYRDGEQVSHTICYSVESYAYAKQNDTTIPHLAELVKRMMCYGDSTRAYVG